MCCYLAPMWRGEVGEDGGELQYRWHRNSCKYLTPVWRGEVGEAGREVQVDRKRFVYLAPVCRGVQ